METLTEFDAYYRQFKELYDRIMALEKALREKGEQ